MSVTHTGIEWTDATWNPVTGCDKVSPGCAHCYAETVAGRFWPKQYPDGVPTGRHDAAGNGPEMRPRAFSDVMCHEDRLDQPLRWRKPRRIFVNSMSDLFHESVPDAFIDRVFAVMGRCEQHTFQILTKRADRMRQYMTSRPASPTVPGEVNIATESGLGVYHVRWPFQNVWLGVSVENQRFADERIPLLLQTPAAARFISAEPLLGPVNFRWSHWDDHGPHPRRVEQLPTVERAGRLLAGSVSDLDGLRMLDWVIVGGESGPDARPFDIAWARSILAQCKSARVPCFVKQLGARPYEKVTSAGIAGGKSSDVWMRLCDRKGGDIDEFPVDLRVRQFPEVRS